MARTFTDLDVATPTTFNLGTGVPECSGFAASRRHPGYLYTHNDSGNPNTVLVISATSGAVVATLTLSVSMIDWEDIAYYWDGTTHWIVVADVGNNSGTRTNQKLIVFPEPATLTSQTVTVTTYPLVVDSPGTGRDCETLLIRPSTGETFLYMKANAGVSSSGLYQGPDFADLQQGGVNHYAQILNHDLHQVTAGDWGDDDYYVLNTNGSDPTFDTFGGMYVFDNTHTLIDSFQGHKTTPTSPSEAVCWSVDGNTIYRGFDGGGTNGKPVYAYPVTWTDPPTADPAVLEPYWKVTGGWRRMRDGVLTSPGGSLPKIPVMSAEAFRGHWGTRIFPSYAAQTGGQLLTPAGKAFLTALKPGFVTHKIGPTIAQDAAIMALIQDLAAAGIPSVLTVGEPFTSYSSSQWNTMLAPLETSLANCVLMVTGQNEVNHVRNSTTPLPSDWAAQAAAHQAELWTRMQAINTNLTALGKNVVKIGSPNLWSGNIGTHNADLATLAPLVRDYCDQAVYHLYPRGGHPTWNLDSFIGQYQAAYPGKPIWCTEAGYFDAVNYSGGSTPVSPASVAVYLRKMWLEYALRGARVSQFEFLDDVDASNSERESNFGLVETPALSPSTWTAKASYTGLAAMTALAGGVSGQIGCRIETASSDIYTLAVNHNAGTRLFLWTRDDIEANLAPITVPTRNVTVTDAAGPHSVNVAGDVVAFDLTGTVT